MLVIQYADGRIQEGILVFLNGDRLRAFARNCDDALDFSLVNGTWVSAECEPVTFRFPLVPFEAAGITPHPIWALTCDQEVFPTTDVN